jgi:hypothetical protein
MYQAKVIDELIERQSRARPWARVAGAVLSVCCVLGVVALVFLVANGIRPLGELWVMPVVLGMGFVSGYVALRGRAPPLKKSDG